MNSNFKIEDLRFLNWKTFTGVELTAELKREYQVLEEKIIPILQKYFYEETITEWVEQNLNTHKLELKLKEAEAHRLKTINK